MLTYCRAGIVTVTLIGIVGCTSIDVKTDFDQSVDFTKFRTFAFAGMTDLNRTGLLSNHLTRKRIETAVERAGGPFDLVVSCASVAGTELAAILAVRDGGTVLFFSMATSFTAAALGAEGVGKDATLLVGNGYVPGHADLTLGLLRRNAGLRGLFEARFAHPS